ncbi:MAG: zinc-binding dehydrogenase [Pseudomonadota bacterium]|nr:zinc-binding dehydrogenase [Pseudomonadota bacterium]
MTVSKQIKSKISKEGLLTISLDEVNVPDPGDGEVLIKVQATPINPSDLGLLVGPADVSSLKEVEKGSVVEMKVPDGLIRSVAARFDQNLPVGNEGSGIVESAGKGAEHLIGKTVGLAGGAMYSEYRCVPASSCLVMNDGTTAEQAASCFVNPLTALGMVETMRMENHTGLVHTAAASNLGQMLIKICLAENIPLVNVVRKEEHVDLLKSLGANYVCNSSLDSFMDDLVDALVQSGSTLGFDATGGGKLSSQILTAMEIAANKTATEYSRYGSDKFKQVYIYGGLDRNPTTLTRSFGFSWGLGGWLLTPFIGRIGPEKFGELRKKVADEIHTTFESKYSNIISLEEALSKESIITYTKQATGKKYLIKPNL